MALLYKLIIIIAMPSFAFFVNRVNGGFTLNYVDFSVKGGVIPLELERSYNSITAVNESNGWNGAFGWGWTSIFETVLTTTADNRIVLRDGATGNSILFSLQKEKPGERNAIIEKIKKAYFEEEKKKTLTKGELSKLSLPAKFLNRLQTDRVFMEKTAFRYGIRGEIFIGEKYVSTEYGYQTVKLIGKEWVREREGITQVFDEKGRLIRQIDKNGYTLIYEYSKLNPSQVFSIRSKDRAQSLNFTWKGNHVIAITDSQNRTSNYFYDEKENLIKVIDSSKQTFIYSYFNKKFPHLLSRIDYPDSKKSGKVEFRRIRYDDNGLIIHHVDRDGSETSFTYGKVSSGSEKGFWTKSVKVFKGKKEERYDEYVLKTRFDGTKYVLKQKTIQNGVATDVEFNECCSLPSKITVNNEVTIYNYYPNGLIKEKISPKEKVYIEYDDRWNKISKIMQNDLVSEYVYDNRGNLIKASNSRKEKVTLLYDNNGRIIAMEDNNNNVLDFKYSSNGKPSEIYQKGLGKILITYSNDDKISGIQTIAENKKRKLNNEESQKIIQHLMTSFQNLIEVIKPAGINFAPI